MNKKIILLLLMVLMVFPGLQAGSKKGKIQLEIFAGLSLMDPTDLNAYPKIWDGYFDFWYQQRFEYNVKVGYIQSFESNQEGDFETIKAAFPLGLRIRWNVSKSLGFSLGFKTVSTEASSYVSHTSRIVEADGAVRENVFRFSPLAISAGGWVPLLGIHFEKKLNSRTGLELYVSGGPFISKCQLSYEYAVEEWKDNVLVSSLARSVLAEGKDTGLTLEAFFRLNHSLSKHLAFFIETGYVYQKVDSLDGPGKLYEDGELEMWEGEWGMKEYYAADFWGQFYQLYPSNSWEYPENKRWAREFFLNLSGFQVRIGFSYRF